MRHLLPTAAKARVKRSVTTLVIREWLAALDITPTFGIGAVLQKQLANEIKNWKTFIKAKDIKAQ